MSDWVSLKQRHDTLLGEFRAKSERVKAIHEEGAIRHSNELTLIAQIKKRQMEMLRTREEAKEKQKMDRRNLVHEQTKVEIACAEENLKRLGLDEESIDQQKQFTILAPLPPSVALAAQNMPLGTESSFDDAMSGKASAYSRRSRRNGQAASASIGSTVHPLVGGVASLLRNVNATGGNSDFAPYGLQAVGARSYQRTKMTAPSALYPTVNKPSNNVQSASDDSSDDEPLVVDMSDIQRGNEYLKLIRAKKLEDTIALKERQVRHHRLKSEQMRSRSEISQKQELSELIVKAKSFNDFDKVRSAENILIDNISSRLASMKQMFSVASNEHLTKLATIALDNQAFDLTHARELSNVAFTELRSKNKMREMQKADEKHQLRVEFCSDIIRGLIGVVFNIVDMSTQQMHDGTSQYRRATVGASRWNAMKHNALHFRDSSTRRTDIKDKNPASCIKDSATVQPSVKILSAELEELASADNVWFKEVSRDYVTQAAVSHSQPIDLTVYSGFFIRGDPVISGVALLEVLVPFCMPQEECPFIVLSPILVHHLFFERQRATLLATIDDLIAQRSALQAEVKSMTPISKASRKEQRPKDSTGPQITLLNDLNAKIISVQADLQNLASTAVEQAKIADEDLIGKLLASLILERRESRVEERKLTSTRLQHNDSDVLTIDSLINHPYLVSAHWFFIGFPTSDLFFTSFAESLKQRANKFIDVELTCDAPTYLRRLSERELLFEHAPEKPLSPSMTEENGKKKRSQKSEVSPTPTIAITSPKAFTSHPFLSPIFRRNVASLENNDAEDAVSPFLHFAFTPSPNPNCIFVKQLSWRDEIDSDEQTFLKNAIEHVPRLAPLTHENLDFLKIEVEICDNEDKIFADLKLSAKSPGQLLPEHNVDLLEEIRTKLGYVIHSRLSSIRNHLNVVKPDIAHHDLEEMFLNIRKSFTEGVHHVQDVIDYLYQGLVDANSQYGKIIGDNGEHAFERLHQCDLKRKTHIASVTSSLANVHELISQNESESSVRLSQTVQALSVIPYAVDRARETLISKPFALLKSLVDKVETVAKHWIEQAFIFYTTEEPEIQGFNLCQREDFILTLDPISHQIEMNPQRGNPTSWQSFFISQLVDINLSTIVSSSEYKRFSLFLRAISPVASFFVPACVSSLPSTAPRGKIFKSWFSLTLVTGRVGPSPFSQVAFPTHPQIKRLVVSLHGRQNMSHAEFLALDWWIPRPMVQNISHVILHSEGCLELPALFHFMCGTESANSSAILRQWLEAIQIFLGSNSEPTSIPFSQIESFFPTYAFNAKELAVLEYLQRNTIRDNQNTQFVYKDLISTSFGRHLLDKAELQHPSI